jgi:glycosyltransferase involved in cell wall biosynthesis
VNAENPPDEILIVDDKSTDSSLCVAGALSSEYGNIRVMPLPKNGGAAAARRDGIAHARNEWIAFVDADDFLEAGAVATAYSKAIQDHSDVCIWDMWRVAETHSWRNIILSPNDFPKTGRQAVIETLGKWRIHPMGVAQKRLYHAAYEGFAEKQLNADELVSRLALANAGSVSLCAKKYFYRLHSQSATQAPSIQRLSTLRSYPWLLQFAKAYPEVPPETIAVGAIAQAWHFLRNRNLYGSEDVVNAISVLTSELLGNGNLSIRMWRRPKHFAALLGMRVFCWLHRKRTSG